jgi:hypothetical protein
VHGAAKKTAPAGAVFFNAPADFRPYHFASSWLRKPIFEPVLDASG